MDTARGHEGGATMTEYALATFLVAILLITAVALFGESLANLFSDVVDALPF